MTQKRKQVLALIITALIAIVVYFLLPIGSKLLKTIRAHSYVYGYTLPKNLVVEDTSKMPPAQAVPILMYHGVTDKSPLGDNTERKVFISQMEMLKQKGYQTISVEEYDLFREGKFTLPAKPIIITFDDGRKDSFYTTDNVLEKLGFKATIFIATIKADENDPFYLSWDELKQMQSTGRWEIEAHGQRSHEEVPIDKIGTLGRYLTARIYSPEKGLESIEDFKKRVESDYVNGVVDIKEHLGIVADYFAVPLSSYGIHDDSNYGGAYEFNQELTRRFFKLAFVEVQQKDGIALESFYSYQNSSPYISLKRFEVKNLSSDDLLKLLERFSPKPPALTFPNKVGLESFLQNTNLLYGTIDTNKGITLMSSTSTPSARMLFGDMGWSNYSIKTSVVREKGRSASIIVYYSDEDNFICLDWGDKSISLIERTNGKEQVLASYYPWEKEGKVEILIRVHDGYIRAYFSGIMLGGAFPIKLSGGAAGFSVWDPNGAQSLLKTLEIVSLDK